MRTSLSFVSNVLFYLVQLSRIDGLGSNVADTGACRNVVTGKQRCAMQASDCEPTHINGDLNVQGEKWYSAYVLDQNGFDACTCADTAIGACMSCNGEDALEFSCAPTETGYCNTGQTQEFFGYNPYPLDEDYCGCASYGRSSSGIAEQTQTRYGACQDLSSESKHFCAYSPAACEDNHVWVQPDLTKQVIGTDCHCANVRIGGCVGGFSNFHCAVTEDDCTWDQYFAPYSLKEKHDHVCSLCESSPTVDEIDEIDQMSSFSKKGLSIGEIVGIAIVPVFGLVVAGSTVYYFVHSKKKTQEVPVPMESPTRSADSDDFNENGILG